MWKKQYFILMKRPKIRIKLISLIALSLSLSLSLSITNKQNFSSFFSLSHTHYTVLLYFLLPFSHSFYVLTFPISLSLLHFVLFFSLTFFLILSFFHTLCLSVSLPLCHFSSSLYFLFRSHTFFLSFLPFYSHLNFNPSSSPILLCLFLFLPLPPFFYLLYAIPTFILALLPPCFHCLHLNFYHISGIINLSIVSMLPFIITRPFQIQF
jgi:hypothetical protein